MLGVSLGREPRPDSRIFLGGGNQMLPQPLSYHASAIRGISSVVHNFSICACGTPMAFHKVRVWVREY